LLKNFGHCHIFLSSKRPRLEARPAFEEEMKVGQSILRKPVVADNMMEELDAPSMDGEAEINTLLGGLYEDDYGDDKHRKHHHHRKNKPKLTMEQHIEYLYWHAWIQTLLQIAIVALLGVIVGSGVVVVSIAGTSQQMAKAVTLVDRVHEMHDYTKTMTDVTTESQAEMRKMMQEYDVNGMINSVKKMVDTGKIKKNVHAKCARF
jgi:hypothetical protein